MKNKFWFGFIIGICGFILGVIGVADCKNKLEKTQFLTGWCIGCLILTSLFVVISLAIIGG